jgi:hypothetical protein
MKTFANPWLSVIKNLSPFSAASVPIAIENNPTPMQARFTDIHEAIRAGADNSVVLPLIKTFLKGGYFKTIDDATMSSLVDHIISNMNGLYALSSQELWDAKIN